MASIDSCFASPMNAHELMSTTSAACGSWTSSYPCSRSVPSMTSLSTLFFGQPSDKRYSVGLGERSGFCMAAVPRRSSITARGGDPLRPRLQRHSASILAAPAAPSEPLIPEVLELRIQAQLVLFSAHQLHDRLQVVARFAGDSHAIALDRALHLQLGILDQLDDRLGLLRLDALREGDELLNDLAALLDVAVLHATQADAALGELLHQYFSSRLQPLLGRAADLDPL